MNITDKKISQKITVTFEFPVYFTEQVFAPQNTTLGNCISQREPQKSHKIMYIIDQGVVQHHENLVKQIEEYHRHYPNLQCVAQPLLVPGGEQCKNSDEIIAHIHQEIEQYKICRHSFVVAIGGGAVLDMVGFACATPHRGVRLIRIPTTVLSQNDSGVGVKNAVNAYNKKNFLGTFAPPFAVINDSEFLKTLQFRDWISGVAEAVKVALIKDRDFFYYLQKVARQIVDRDLSVMEEVIYRCAELHLDHIRNNGDPFELGYARPLDFGHWAAHKLESMSNYQLRHGEAVACGIALDSYYSMAQNLVTKEEFTDICDLLQELGFSLYHPMMQSEELLRGIEEFREHLGGVLCITLLKGIGNKLEVSEICHETVRKAISHLQQNKQWD